MATFFTSDHHFGHVNIIGLERMRAHFPSVESMEGALIERWNRTVTSADTVFHLGDLGLVNTDRLREIIDRLNFDTMIIIRGNHDKSLASLGKLPGVVALPWMRTRFHGLGDVLLVHDPHEAEADVREGELIIHGHVHSNPLEIRTNRQRGPAQYCQFPADGDIPEQSFFHVGVDAHKFRPLRLEEIVGMIRRAKKAATKGVKAVV